MDQTIYDSYVRILRRELVPALGCTEPIAIAYAGAKAREVLGTMPESVHLRCSGNIVKNVKGVTVPNSDGMMGLEAAVTLGIVGGDASRGLEVLQSISRRDIQRTRQLLAGQYCTCALAEQVENLYIEVSVAAGGESAAVEIQSHHTHITKILKNGRIVFSQDCAADADSSLEQDRARLNVQDILSFANEVALSDVQETLERQMEMNGRIAREGLAHAYGAQVGRTLLKYYDSGDVRVRARAMAAAGSDARMSGCSLPVVINSGSGNQGMTVSLPVVEYARELDAGHDRLCRALVVANLIALLQKYYIGSLSAFCGAVCAGTGAACGICYLHGGGYEEIARTITNTLCNVGGIVCDGAKPSCAAKIAAAVDAGILGFLMASKEGTAFRSGEGLVQEDIEQTIQSVGRVGREGMRSTDLEILNIMLGK